jgi:hypothetical protein
MFIISTLIFYYFHAFCEQNMPICTTFAVRNFKRSFAENPVKSRRTFKSIVLCFKVTKLRRCKQLQRNGSRNHSKNTGAYEKP